MIKSIAAITSLAALAFTAAAPAQAKVWRDTHIQGYYVPYIYETPTRGGWDRIHVEGPKGLEEIRVRCAPFDWESYGPHNSGFVDRIARSWCF